MSFPVATAITELGIVSPPPGRQRPSLLPLSVFLALLLFCFCAVSPAAFAAETSGVETGLQVLSVLPVEPERNLTRILVRFSENMRPLGTFEEDAATVPLRITADSGAVPEGNYRWMDPATLSYVFAAPVNRPLNLKVCVPAGTQALSGNSLEKETCKTVGTPPLQITVPLDGKDNRLSKDARGEIGSNYELNLDDLKSKTWFSLDGKDVPVAVHEPTTAQGEEGLPEYWGYPVEILAELPMDTEAQLKLEPGIRLVGSTIKSQSFIFPFRTYEALKLEEWDMIPEFENEESKKKAPESPLVLHFNNPVLRSALLAHLEISPKVDRLPFEGEEEESGANDKDNKNPTVFDPQDGSHQLNFRWQPRTGYTVTLRAGLQDANGAALARDKSFTFTTGELYPFFDMPNRGIQYMEPALGGLFPILARNTSPIKVQLRYFPWKDLAQDWGSPVETRQDVVLPEQANGRSQYMLDIPKLLGFASAADLRGYVLLRVDAPLAPDRRHNDKTHEEFNVELQMARLGLHIRAGKESGLVWVTDLATGRPVQGAKLQIISSESRKSLWQGESDANGLASLPARDDKELLQPLLMAEYAGEITKISMPQNYLSPFYDAYWQRWQAHMVSQLPLYQPGQEVRFTLYTARIADAKNGEPLDPPSWRPTANQPLTLTLRDSHYREILSHKAVTNSYGSIAASLTLPADAPSGRYTFQVKAEDLSSDASGHAFEVASFRPPDFKVDVTPPADQPAPVGIVKAGGEADTPVAVQVPGNGASAAPPKLAEAASSTALEATIQAGYFSGAPLSGAAVGVQVYAQDTSFVPTPLQGYSVGQGYGAFSGQNSFYNDTALPEYYPYGRQRVVVQAFSGVLDEKGRMRCDVPTIPMEGWPRSVSFEAIVRDPSGLTSQGAASFMLHPASLYVGLRAPYVALANTDASLEIKTATWNNLAQQGAKVRLKAERVLRGKGRPTGPNGESLTEKAWEKTVLVQKAEGESFSIRFDRAGEYRLTATVADEQGRENSSSVTVYVPGNEASWFGGGETKALELIPDAKEYTPGATARILLKNPFAETEKVWALITTERMDIRTQQVQEVSGTTPIIEVPLTKEYAPYVFVSVVLVKGRTAPPPNVDVTRTSPDVGAPAFASARTCLMVRGEPEGLNVSMTTDAKEYRPGGKVAAEVKVTTKNGTARKAQVTLLAVDERVLRAAGEHNNYTLSRTFDPAFIHGLQQTDTRSSLLDLGVRVINGYDLGGKGQYIAHQRIAGVAGYFTAGKMASTPDATGGEQEPLRGNFTPMAFWLAEGETDDTGRLTASFTLPDTLTGYRLVAVAVDAEAYSATTESGIRANKPLQIISSLPRFFTGSDSLEARFLVQNTGSVKSTVTVTVTGEGLTLPAGTKTLTLEPGTTGVVSFPVRIDVPGNADLTVTDPSGAAAGGLAQPTASVTVHAAMNTGAGTETDKARFIVPVFPPQPLTTVAASGMLQSEKEFRLPIRLQLPAGQELDLRSRLQVIFAASPVAGLSLTADTVLEYPWGCLEQRLSKAWVRAIRLQHGKLLGMQAVAEDVDILRKVMASVPAFQTQSGGFALWDKAGRAEPYLTTFVLLVNSRMGQLGIEPSIGLPADVTARAVVYLHNALRTDMNQRTKDAPSGEFGEFGPDTRAMALLALSEYAARENRILVPRALALMEQEKDVPAMAWAAMLLALQQTPDIEDRTALSKQVLTKLDALASITPTELHFVAKGNNRYWYTMGSSLRDNGLVLAALARANPDYPHLDALALWVSREIADRGKYLSTQEGIFGLWGLTAYLQNLEGSGPVEIKAVWNKNEKMTHAFTRLIDQPREWTLPAASLAKAVQNPESKSGKRTSNDKDDPALVLTALRGKPHWTARLRWASSALPVAAENMGFNVEHIWPSTGSQGVWRVGDVAEVKLEITVNEHRRHALAFVPFPAGFEPLHATRVDLAKKEEGRYQWPWEWQDVRTDGILLYTRGLAPGKYTYSYKLRAAAPGVFVLRPAHAEEMYAPEVFGRTAGSVVEVKGE